MTQKSIVGEFRKRFYDTEKFFDPFAGGKFAQYLFVAHEKAGRALLSGNGPSSG